MIPTAVARLLRCPRCHAPLTELADAMQCTAPHCSQRYGLVDGVPLLLDERFSTFRFDDYLGGALHKQPQSRLHALALRFLPSLDLNVAARRNARRLRDELFARTCNPVILNIGGKHPRAALAALRRDPLITCVECDCVPGPSVIVLADSHTLPFAGTTFDAVIVDGVLEHGAAPHRIVSEIHRVLRPQGIVYADTPFMLPVHAGAYDFQRFTRIAHRRLFRSFRELDAGVSSGPAAALGYSIQSLLLSFARGRRSRFAVKTLCRLTLFWLKYLDHFLAARPAASDAALGFYFLGERTDGSLDDRTLLQTYVGNTPDLYARASTQQGAPRRTSSQV